MTESEILLARRVRRSLEILLARRARFRAFPSARRSEASPKPRDLLARRGGSELFPRRGAAELRRSLEDRGLHNEVALCEARGPERMKIKCSATTSGDDLRNGAAGGRGMHDAMPSETCTDNEAL